MFNQSEMFNTAPSFFLPSGLVISPLGSDYIYGGDAIVNKDGQIFMVGHANDIVNLVSYGANGRLNSKFDSDGIVKIAFETGNSTSFSLAVTVGNQLLMAGSLFKRDSSSFVSQGTIETPRWYSVHLTLTRFNSDGSLDNSFGDHGTVENLLFTERVLNSQVAVQADGKILLAGTADSDRFTFEGNSYGVLARYQADGSVDKSFLGGGTLTLTNSKTYFNDVMPLADGKILVAGSIANGTTQWDFALFRFNSNGTWDASFGGNGKVTVDFTKPSSPLGFPSRDSIEAVAQQSDGKIIAVGDSQSGLTLIRLLSNGQLDASFGDKGKVLSGVSGSLNDVVLQADGKILVAGESNGDFVLARYLANGSLDTQFGGDGYVFTDFGSYNDSASSISLSPNGNIIVTGTSNGLLALASYRSDGGLITGFGQPFNTANSFVMTAQNSDPVLLNRRIVVRDAELNDRDSYAGASLTLQRQTGANVADVFSSASDSSLSFADNRIKLYGEDLGTSQQSGGKLTLKFTQATQHEVNQVLQHIAYHNTAHEPTQTIKLVWQFNDGDSSQPLSAVGTTTVRLLSDNTLPTGHINIEGIHAVVNTLTATAQELVDRDGLGPLGYQWQSSTDGGLTWHNETTGNSIVLTQALLARQIKVIANYKDGLGYQESIYSILGSQGNDVITSGIGDQVLMGAEGDDWISSGSGNDVLKGGAGNDTLVCNTEGDKTIDGGDGIDWLVCSSQSRGVSVSLDDFSSSPPGYFKRFTSVKGIEHVSGTAFDDNLNGDYQANSLIGGNGDDILFGGGGIDSLNGGAGDDGLNGGDGIDWAQYWSAPSGVTVNLTQTTAQNTGGAGIDTLWNMENLNGSTYHDKLTGNNLNNVLLGNGGNDVLLGNEGDDSLSGGGGNDTLNGGVGSDWAQYWQAKAGVTVNLAQTTAQNTGGAGIDILLGIEKINGSAFNDKLTGNHLANILLGGSGNDLLNGSLGTDLLKGGIGQDSFLFNTNLGVTNSDKIIDFNPADDTIQLDNAIFTKLTSSGVLNPTFFKIGTTASDHNDYIVYNSNTGGLYYDADGNGSAVAIQIALLGSKPNLTHTDFVVV